MLTVISLNIISCVQKLVNYKHINFNNNFTATVNKCLRRGNRYPAPRQDIRFPLQYSFYTINTVESLKDYLLKLASSFKQLEQMFLPLKVVTLLASPQKMQEGSYFLRIT